MWVSPSAVTVWRARSASATSHARAVVALDEDVGEGAVAGSTLWAYTTALLPPKVRNLPGAIGGELAGAQRRVAQAQRLLGGLGRHLEGEPGEQPAATSSASSATGRYRLTGPAPQASAAAISLS